MIGLRPILSDSQPNRMKHGVPIASAIAIMIWARGARNLQRLREEEQRVELSAVPDDGFAGGGAEQRQDRDFEHCSIGRRLR